MRKITKTLSTALTDAQAADERLASKVEALHSFCDKVERTGEDRRQLLKAAIDDFHDHVSGEMQIMRTMLQEIVSELRGLPAQVVQHEPPKLVVADKK